MSVSGVGFGVLMISFLCTIYYNVLVAYVLYYMYESLKIDVPWRHCNNWWNTKNCVQDFKAFRDSKSISFFFTFLPTNPWSTFLPSVGKIFLKARQWASKTAFLFMTKHKHSVSLIFSWCILMLYLLSYIFISKMQRTASPS